MFISKILKRRLSHAIHCNYSMAPTNDEDVVPTVTDLQVNEPTAGSQ